MGMFKDMRDLHKMGKEETKERGGMFRMAKDGLADRHCKVDRNDNPKLLLTLA